MFNSISNALPVVALSSLATLLGCGDDVGAADMQAVDAPAMDGPMDAHVPDGGGMTAAAYSFESRFEVGQSSVSYSGQTLRHVLIDDLKEFVGHLDDLIDGDSTGQFETAEQIRAALDFYVSFGDEGLTESPRLHTSPALLQESYGDISSAKSLRGKIAGQDHDGARDHQDWNGGDFVGWSTMLAGHTPSSPERLVDGILDAIAELGAARAAGHPAVGPNGETLPPYLTPEGIDLQQLLHKVLQASIPFAQGTDDYLDEGLSDPNTRVQNEPYTALEHAWDEGFGYYGATRDHDLYSTDEVAAKGGRPDWQGAHDSNGDGRIDLRTEYQFGLNTNASKRDRGSTTGTTFGSDGFAAFLEGRQIIADAGDVLTAAEQSALESARDRAVLAWESAAAATVIHYINETQEDQAELGTDDYEFQDHSKHFAEMKGFALAFQFNPRSSLGLDTFARIHSLLGDSPNLEAANVETRAVQLSEARALLAAAFGFVAADVDGW